MVLLIDIRTKMACETASPAATTWNDFVATMAAEAAVFTSWAP
jgi:hypothetical protein